MLCLADGLYRGSEQMITPPRGLKGTHNAPITIRATNDGGVTLDAQHAGNAVWLGWHDGVGPNDWFVVEGVNANITLHVCYGNRYGKPSFEGSYKFLFPAILEAKINTVSMEFARRG